MGAAAGGTTAASATTTKAAAGGTTAASATTTKATTNTTAKTAVTTTPPPATPRTNLAFTFQAAVDRVTLQNALTASFKAKYGSNFIRLEVTEATTTDKPKSRRRLATRAYHV